MAASSKLQDKLETTRRELLELSTRNRLLNTPRRRTRSRSIEVVDELSEEVFRILVKEGRAMSFDPRPESEDEAEPVTEIEKGTTTDHVDLAEAVPEDKFEPAPVLESDEEPPALPMGEEDEEPFVPLPGLDQPEDEDVDERGVAKRHTDNKLQTELTSEELQKRLLNNFYDARTFEEEQGVNILFLALGFLKWFDKGTPDKARHAPLILVPVTLERQSAKTRFKLRYADEDVSTNLSLQAKLKTDFAIDLPELSDLDDISPTEYFDQVKSAVAGEENWEVLPNDQVLWFFSFTKFLMYRDLDAEQWPEDAPLAENPVIDSLLQQGFEDQPEAAETTPNLDELIAPEDLTHVLDADGSQTLAIEEIRQGKHLVIQGPPGTGKSQTITNLIAAAVRQGKTVLFVAEKMAALEVVKRRLDNIGLGEMCLELHSHKAKKSVVLQELGATLQLGKPEVADVAAQAAKLGEVRNRLNRYVQTLHKPHPPAELSAFEIMGELIRLRSAGLSSCDFELPAAVKWEPEQIAERESLVKTVATHLQTLGTPVEHSWKGVMKDSMLPSDLERLTDQLPELETQLAELQQKSRSLADRLQQKTPGTLRELHGLTAFARQLAAAPALESTCWTNDIWTEKQSRVEELVEHGEQLAKARQELEGVVIDLAWETDVSRTRINLAAHGSSLFRLFKKDYRTAQATLTGLLTEPPPKSLAKRLAILDALLKARKARELINKRNKTGTAAFGKQWEGEDSDWEHLTKVVGWVKQTGQGDAPDNALQILAETPDPASLQQSADELQTLIETFTRSVQEVRETLALDEGIAFGKRMLPDESPPFSFLEVSLEEYADRLKRWQENREGITNWITWRHQSEALIEAGLTPLAERLFDGSTPPDQAEDLFRFAFLEALMRERLNLHPTLARFDGQSFEQLITEFQELDEERIRLARQEVALAHYQRIPRGGANAGELGVLRREIQKKRRHLPLRQLLKQAGHATQALKPVFMMSPMSIAQYLEPGALEFDLLLIDEASQVRPVDALGAIARCKQIVVVGDDKQLPPTRFFNTVLGDQGAAEDADDFQAGDLESILGLCTAQNVPQRMLRWHYRSRHHSLITVSNREFYENNLNVIPSPFHENPELGLRFHHLPDATFDRGKSATNKIEAQAVAAAVMEHARNTPDLTLGVGAFSVSQRDAILYELEVLRRADSDTEGFFSSDLPEPFFVKNLENIQGDERDVILISVGYGRDPEGKLTMNFGPLSSKGGERRLNVLITRAKRRCEIYSSITAADIDLKRATGRGPAAFKHYLQYAEQGELEAASREEDAADSRPANHLEKQLKTLLEERGYQADTNVGVAGVFMDLAVQHPAEAGRYLLGIESDGGDYRSAMSARDRDRLRPQVLHSQGWQLQRQWSPDWYFRPEEQLQRLLDSLEVSEQPAAASTEDIPTPTDTAPEPAEPTIARGEPVVETEDAPHSEWVIPYEEAAFEIPEELLIADMPTADLAKIVEKIVTLEAPIHQEELVRRVVSLSSAKRSSAKMTEAIEAAIDLLRTEERLANGEDQPFLRISDQNEVLLRSRADVDSNSLRKPEMLPPEEIRLALVTVIEAHLGMNTDEAIVEATRLLGYKVTNAGLRETVEPELEWLLNEKQLVKRDEMLYVK